ncbi:hypothetical protein Q427_01420 [Halomonas sp. BC04]|nr:hypothetical protein Q427_01420 [Halomonas sp. BC04]
MIARWTRQSLCQTRHGGRAALLELYRAGLLEVNNGEVSLSPLMDLNPTIKLAASHREKLAALLPVALPALGLTAEQKVVWNSALASSLDGWSREDQLALVDGLRRLSDALPAAYSLGTYIASARYLMGSSKLLDSLPSPLLRAFGIERSRFSAADAWLLASMPSAPEGVLLIENLQSFTQACRTGLDQRLALVCSFGYGLSLGEALIGIEQVRLVGEGTLPHTLAELLDMSNQSYWGDLDPEGLRIFLRLRARLPGLRLSALYGPMIEAFSESTGHPLHRMTGKANQRLAGDWARGLDQEWLDDAALIALAGQALDPKLEARWLAFAAH